MEEAKQINIPGVLLGVAILSTALYGMLQLGAFGSALASFGLKLVIGVPVALVACMLTAGLVGTSFGNFGPACVKLAAIYMLPYSINL